MILSIVFNNFDLSFSFISQKDLNIRSFLIKQELGKDINNYFADFDKNIDYLKINIRDVVQVICCVSDLKIKEILMLYFKERVKIFPFFIEKKHFDNFFSENISAPVNILLNSFGAYKKYREQNIISILCEEVISVSYIENGLFIGYSVFPNFTLISNSLSAIKSFPDFIVSFKTESLNKDIYNATSNGVFSAIIGAIKFHIHEIIENNKLNINNVQIVASGNNLFEIPNFIQEIKEVADNLFEIASLEIVKNSSKFY